MSALMKEIDAIQADMVCMEGMLEALAKGAYTGTRVEYIGNSLEILKDYLGQRAERLDMLCSPFLKMWREGDAAAGKSLSDKCSGWDRFSADAGRLALQSREVEAAYKRLSPYLEKLSGKQQEALCLVIRDIGAASRKQGFTEGFTAAVGRICGEEDTDG